MSRILDLAASRQARHERNELFQTAGKDLLTLLEHQREHIPEEFMTFLVGMAIADQALHYAQGANDKQAGLNYIEQLFYTARQVFESHHLVETRAPLRASKPGRIVEFLHGESLPESLESAPTDAP